MFPVRSMIQAMKLARFHVFGERRQPITREVSCDYESTQDYDLGHYIPVLVMDGRASLYDILSVQLCCPSVINNTS